MKISLLQKRLVACAALASGSGCTANDAFARADVGGLASTHVGARFSGGSIFGDDPDATSDRREDSATLHNHMAARWKRIYVCD
jgi:hypothetical protein